MFERPSLKALRVFLEVVRAGGYGAAAARIGVTPSAVSHLVAALDAEFGGQLFEDRRRARLSERGARLAARLEPAFSAIDHAVAETRAPRAAIRLSTLSTFAVLWLVPRLGALRARLPDVDILISTDTRPVDLVAEPFDCAIRWAARPPEAPGLLALPLFRETLVVVANPRLLAGGIGDVAALPRLAARSRPGDWDLILAARGEAGRAPAGGVTVFETRGQMLEAAVAGLGAAVIDLTLVGASLAAGHLALAAPERVERPEAYHFLCRREALGERPLRILHDWLKGEASE